jgi:GxxExxY protein
MPASATGSTPERDPLSERVIGAAIAVHRLIGPGMLESVYQACLQRELDLRGIPFQSWVALPVTYKGLTLTAHFCLDLIVDSQMVVEIKSVERLVGVHRAQLITYLRLGQFHRGLLINFNVARLVDGVVRVVV